MDVNYKESQKNRFKTIYVVFGNVNCFFQKYIFFNVNSLSIKSFFYIPIKFLRGDSVMF